MMFPILGIFLKKLYLHTRESHQIRETLSTIWAIKQIWVCWVNLAGILIHRRNFHDKQNASDCHHLLWSWTSQETEPPAKLNLWDQMPEDGTY